MACIQVAIIIFKIAIVNYNTHASFFAITVQGQAVCNRATQKQHTITAHMNLYSLKLTLTKVTMPKSKLVYLHHLPFAA